MKAIRKLWCYYMHQTAWRKQINLFDPRETRWVCHECGTAFKGTAKWKF